VLQIAKNECDCGINDIAELQAFFSLPWIANKRIDVVVLVVVEVERQFFLRGRQRHEAVR